jgi:superfamily II DNA or RNA helicase
MVTLIVENVYTKIVGDIDNEVITEIIKEMSYEISNYNPYNGVETQTFSLFKYLNRIYPTGLYSFVTDILKKHNINFKIVDKRDLSLHYKPFETNKLYLRDYQQNVLNQALKAKRGVIQIATGGGKTELAAKLIADIGLKAIFLVHTYDLLHQAADRFEKYYDFKVGRISGSECFVSDKVNVCMIQTLHYCLKKKYILFDDEEQKYNENSNVKSNVVKNILDTSDVLIVDEGHKIAAQSYINIMESTNCVYRYCMSATPQRSDGRTIHLQAYTGMKFTPITASYLITQNYLVRPIIYLCNIYKQKFIYSKSNYTSTYKKYIVENEYRNKVIAVLVKKLISQNKHVLITVTQKKHGKILLKLLKTVTKSDKIKFLYSDVSKEDRINILEDMRNGKLNVLIGTSLADEGLDIPILDVLILAGAGKSITRIPQRIGRVLRLYENKKNVYVFDFVDNVRYLRGQLRERIEIYKQEKEFIINNLDYTKNANN